MVITGFSNKGGAQNLDVTIPTFAYPNLGKNSPARQNVAAGGSANSAWFVVRTGINTASVFNKDGTQLSDLGEYSEGISLSDGITSVESEGEERPVAAGGTSAFIGLTGVGEDGKNHPCVVVVHVDTGAQTATVQRMVRLDDDLVDPPDFADPTAMDLYANTDGNLIVCWRESIHQSPIARYFDANGDPLSSSFWVSSLENEDINTGDATIKCAANQKISAVAWLSESFDPGVNCKGQPMQRDTIVRFFHPPWAGEPPTPAPTDTPTLVLTATPRPTFLNERSDIDGNDEVDALDLLILLSDWKKATE